MEVRANFILVGAFTIFVVLGGLGFTLWLVKADKRVSMVEYDIAITENVTGLGLNSDVLFTGIRVGFVSQITISDTTPGEVNVRISIFETTPVRENSVASLESRGLTGVVVVSISGGTAEAALVRPHGGAISSITFRPSPFATVMEHVPNTVEATNRILMRMDSLFSDENIRTLSSSLKSLGTLATTLEQRSGSIDALLVNAEQASGQIAAITASANTLLTKDIREASTSLNSMAHRLETLLASMEPGLRQFSKEGLPSLNMLLVETRSLVNTYTRIGQKLENDPRRFLFGETVQEYRPK